MAVSNSEAQFMRTTLIAPHYHDTQLLDLFVQINWKSQTPVVYTDCCKTSHRHDNQQSTIHNLENIHLKMEGMNLIKDNKHELWTLHTLQGLLRWIVNVSIQTLRTFSTGRS